MVSCSSASDHTAPISAILEHLEGRLQFQDTNYRRYIPPPVERLSLTYLAFGNEAAVLAQQYCLGLCTVSRIIKDTCGKIYDEFRDEYLHTPAMEEEWNAIIEDFLERWQYPGCIGRLDGKHIRIKMPNKSGTLYFNYKKYFSIVLLAIVNSNYEFVFLDGGAEGIVVDGGYWNGSTFCESLSEGDLNIPKDFVLPGTEEKISVHIVADDAFAMSKNLLKPFSHRNLTPHEQVFNHRLSRARGVVENVLGILSSHFRVFHSEIQMNPGDTSLVVIAACTLHNILWRCIGKSYMNTGSLPVQEDDDVVLDGLKHNNARNPTKVAKNMCEKLSDYFMSREGEVGWQYGKIIY